MESDCQFLGKSCWDLVELALHLFLSSDRLAVFSNSESSLLALWCRPPLRASISQFQCKISYIFHSVYSWACVLRAIVDGMFLTFWLLVASTRNYRHLQLPASPLALWEFTHRAQCCVCRFVWISKAHSRVTSESFVHLLPLYT